MNYRYLSYVLGNNVPIYGSNLLLSVEKKRSIDEGDSTNISQANIGSHLGTHVDAPNHFFNLGKKIFEYPASTWIFRFPQVIDVSLDPCQILGCDEYINRIKDCSDIVLFRSGWSNKRKEKKYVDANPGISKRVALYFRKNFPCIRAIGIDWVSISSYQKRHLGREAHRAFLNPKGFNKPILIVEDMDLSGDISKLKEIYIFPLMIDDFDSAPCTVIGCFND